MPSTNFTMLVANRPRLLKQALDSVGDLSDATVMIRDAGMNPDVFDVCSEWAIARDVKGIHYSLRTESLGTGTARNEVIQYAEKVWGRGTYLYLSDDDVFFKRSDWLKILIDTYEQAWKDGFRVIGAYNHPYHQPIGHYVYNAGIFVQEVYSLALQSMLMKWEVWDKYGPFKSTPAGAVCQGEDVDFGNQITEDGGKLGVIYPSLLVNCGLTNSFGQPIPGHDLVKAQVPAGVIAE